MPFILCKLISDSPGRSPFAPFHLVRRPSVCCFDQRAGTISKLQVVIASPSRDLRYARPGLDLFRLLGFRCSPFMVTGRSARPLNFVFSSPNPWHFARNTSIQVSKNPNIFTILACLWLLLYWHASCFAFFSLSPALFHYTPLGESSSLKHHTRNQTSQLSNHNY